MLTAQDAMQHVGRLAMWRVPSSELEVQVKVLDARSRWGRLDCLVTPVEGRGEQWIQADRLRYED